ncbi:MAG: polysaccharide biosynthesis/export family protein [Candidatus Sulfotelmatobacter sp.]
MKRAYQFVSLTAILVWMFGFGSAVFAQEETKDLGGGKQSSHLSLTGAGVEDDELTATKPGKADGRRNPMLGGERRPLYRLRPSDVAEVTFTVAPEFNQILTVQPDGYVMLKDVGPLDAEGLTMPEFAEAVQKAYRGYLHDPEAAVVLKDFERPYFIVGGQVGKPGKYEMRSDTTVAEAVQIAGGFTSEAKHSQVVLFRRVNDDLMETRVLDLKKMLKQSSLKEDAHLRPGDLIFVPQNTISKIARFMSKPSVSMYMNSSQF